MVGLFKSLKKLLWHFYFFIFFISFYFASLNLNRDVAQPGSASFGTWGSLVLQRFSAYSTLPKLNLNGPKYKIGTRNGPPKSKWISYHINDKGNIRLRWRYHSKRYPLNLGLRYSKSNLIIAKKVANIIEDDISKEKLDTTLLTYTNYVSVECSNSAIKTKENLVKNAAESSFVSGRSSKTAK